MLRKSQAIRPGDLEAVAGSRGEQHLLAIADRRELAEDLTDILLQRGGRNVCRALVRNSGARFSAAGQATLVAKARDDDEVTKDLSLRTDAILRELPSAAPGEAIGGIADATDCELRQRIKEAAGPIARGLGVKERRPVDYSEARSTVVALSRIGKLNDSTVNRFAMRNETANLIASLSVLSDAPTEIIESIMADADCTSLVMACRASRLNWQTTLTILKTRDAGQLSDEQRERAQQLFEELYLSTSQWAVRWGDMAAGAGRTAASNNGAKSGAKR
ncbi:DUF2336 domain-containing protein [Bradyrhizobium sp.]|uniref:DUF2336 domain-containing protein n=1 Tax=Bradyrhizobium sp. TaxID=376 RepID=UPI00344D8F09